MLQWCRLPSTENCWRESSGGSEINGACDNGVDFIEAQIAFANSEDEGFSPLWPPDYSFVLFIAHANIMHHHSHVKHPERSCRQEKAFGL
mmetsp:Transcript_15119/g.25849  ORF Transcript_15119/g.25849 Transcript_15119/m.25849 type:complete len:90 (+) Transcript_15119:593-862(+)